jgi:hypothetical protein
MIFACNTTITILGAVTQIDAWGDPMDVNVPIATGIPGSITEVSADGRTEISTVPRVIRKAVCRMSSVSSAMVTENARIKDETTGFIWTINEVAFNNNVLGHQPVRIDMQRAS